MIIDKIHIENFGKLSNFTLDLKNGLNEIYGENGFGKTTLSIFIKAMLYGMPAARENLKMERKKYMPWQGGEFGGYIEYSTSKGRFRLTRFFGKTPESDVFELFNLSTKSVLEKPKNEIGEDLFGIGRETFEMTAFFPQNNFLSFANNQISANILGLDKLKYDLANVNLAIDKIKKKESEIKKLKTNKEQLTKKKNQLLELKNELILLQNSLEKSQFEIEVLKKNFQEKTDKFEELKKQHLLQKDLFSTKEKIEKELLSLSCELNRLHQEQDRITELAKNTKTCDAKKMKSIKNLLLISGVFLLLVPVLLASFSIISPVVAVVIAIGVIVAVAVFFILINNKIKSEQNRPSLDIVNKEMQQNSDSIKQTRSAIDRLQKNLEVYKDLKNIDEIYYMSKEELSNLKVQIEKQELLQGNFSKEIDKIIDSIDNIKDDINNFESKDLEIKNKLTLLNQTKEYLMQANQNVSKRFVEPVNKVMSKIIEKFKLGNREFVVDTNLEFKQVTDKGVKEFDYSSQGIKDILSFCLRVYFICEIYKQEKPVIVLDDAFVNLDDENIKKAGEILNQLSLEYQIIYIYCNDRCKTKKS